MSTTTRVTTHAGCCCPPGDCECACCDGVGYWTQYTFTISGVFDSLGCPECVDLNGSWTVATNGACSWITAAPDPPFCTGTGPYWSLTCSAGTWKLSNHADGATYETTSNLCLLGGTLSLTLSGGLCDGYPATVTISTAGVFVPCV